MASYTIEHVIDVRHWSDALFSFTTTRNPGLRFENGQFIMLGLDSGRGGRITRAYSMASANYEDHLEFYSIKVPNGPLTSRLKFVGPGSPVLVSSKPTGTLVLRDLKPGKRLFLLATGTGVAPFLAVAKDPETYGQFEQVFLIRGARTQDGLAYADSVLAGLRTNPYLGEFVGAQFNDHPTLTREAFRNQGRITSWLETASLSPQTDRFMVCGNMRMIDDVNRLLAARGFNVSPRIGVPGDYVIERAFVESFDTRAEQANAASR
jgi:ferredoxin--NADP+ reductase